MQRKIAGYSILAAIYIAVCLTPPLLTGEGIVTALAYLGGMTLALVILVAVLWGAVSLIMGDDR